MITSQRSESINFFFNDFVNVNIKLFEFVHQYDKVVAACRSSETQQDFRGLNCEPNYISNSYEIQVLKFYTIKIFQLFQKEWDNTLFGRIGT